MSATSPIYRTPDSAFAGVADFPFPPSYLEWDGLRTHYLDVGPREGPVALLLHGEPTWSYLYRKMIPPLVAAGYRCIAPDHIGFGRSDKVLDDDWYTIDRHVERLKGFIERLDLTGVTLFVQDWGGPTGLINAVEMPERFDRLVILNTWLHHPGFRYAFALRYWREVATHPLWLPWTGGDLPCGPAVVGALARPPANALEVVRAYDAPFPERGAVKAGPRRFPWCLPFAEPEAGAADRQTRAYTALQSWKGPIHVIFGEDDAMFPPSWGREWAGILPGATFDVVPRAGHFIQDDAGEEVVSLMLARARAPA